MRVQIFGNGKGCGDARSVLDKTLKNVEGKIIVAVGGDGTFLKAMAKSVASKVPVLCIRNHGSKGVLAEGDVNGIKKIAEMVRDKKFSVVRYHMLEARGGKNRMSGFNEIGFFRTTEDAIRFDLFINGMLFYKNVIADGGIVSTPAGSTAYNISAGGPVVAPDTDNLVFTPISPHGFNKPVVFSGTARVVFHRYYARAFADGKKLSLVKGLMEIRKSDNYANVISLGTPFYTRWQRIVGAC